MKAESVPDCAEVSLAKGPATYAAEAPFSPGEQYPEYTLGGTGECGANHAYAAVREALRLLRLDADHFGTGGWNPLSSIVRPGDTVVLKPNLVRDFRETRAGHEDCLITHGAIIRAVLDYVFKALQGRGRAIIADAPHSDADFSALRRMAGLDKIRRFYGAAVGFAVEVMDLRPEWTRKIDGVIVGHEALPGDPAGYVRVNLGACSAFAEINHLCHRLYGSEYDRGELVRHQHDGTHEYLISRTVLDADCVISLAKLKTHKKAGITVNMKNLVGINGNKNWLPHHREGTPRQGGDQFACDGLTQRLEGVTLAGFRRVFPRLGGLRPLVAGPVKKLGKRVFGDTDRGTIRSGNWHGNDTVWRMVMDLNRILLYADAGGGFHDRPVRRVFNTVDGIVGGEGNGPLDPTPKSVGVVLAGFNPVAVDLACAAVMGFDASRLPVLHRAFGDHGLPLVRFQAQDVVCMSNDVGTCGPLEHIAGHHAAFEPHVGWKGHVEMRLRTEGERATAGREVMS